MQEKLLIEKLNRTDKDRDGNELVNKLGKPYTRLGVYANGKWYSGFSDDWNSAWVIGDTIEVTTEKTTGRDGKTYYNLIAPESKKAQSIGMQEQLDRIEAKIDKILGA